MATKKRSRTRRPGSRPRAKASSRPSLKTVPNQIAVRYGAGHERKVREALEPLGTVECYPLRRVALLRRGSGTAGGRVQTVLEHLQRAGLVEFVTPVLVDRDTNTRQVLTDEIVLRLKPGRTRRALAALEAEHGIKVGRRNPFEPSQYIVKVAKPSGTHTLDVARSLDRSDDVEFASPNFMSEIKR
jgi:hypothetical protein